VPARERLWRHDQSLASPPRKKARKCGEQGAIGRPHQGAPLLPAERGQLGRNTSTSTSLANSLRRFLTSNRSTATQRTHILEPLTLAELGIAGLAAEGEGIYRALV
jgi:hypothetical protein